MCHSHPVDSPLSRFSEDPSEEAAAAASEAALSNSASAFHSLSACSSAFRVIFWDSEMQWLSDGFQKVSY